MQLPPICERLVLTELADFDTWTWGGSGVGTLLIPKGQFFILLRMDYFHFVDEPQIDEGTDAQAILTLRPDDPSLAFNLQGLNISGVPLVSPDVAFDPLDVPTSEANLQAWLDTFFLGFICTCQLSGGIWKVSIFSTPGATYNGQIIDGGLSVAGLVIPGVFAGGADALPLSPNQVKRGAIHQIEVRQKGKNRSWCIYEDVQLVPTAADESAYFNVTGKYQVDMFLPFHENLQLDICRVPTPDQWTVTFQGLPNKSNEPASPAGYGISGTPDFSEAATEILFDAITNEQYLPLTVERDDTAPLDYTPQFRVAFKDTRQLRDPSLPSENDGNSRKFPLINFHFLRVNMNYDDFRKMMQAEVGFDVQKFNTQKVANRRGR